MDRPNVIFIMSDQQRWDLVGWDGNLGKHGKHGKHSKDQGVFLGKNRRNPA